MIEEKQRSRKINALIALCIAVFLAVTAAMVGYFYRTSYMVSATVSLDVNPSIDISINNLDKVLSVNPLNEDAHKIVGDMDFKGDPLDKTVNALLGSMLKNGYLTESSNSVLITVAGRDPVQKIYLREKLSQNIGSYLKNESFDAAVFTQGLMNSESYKASAERYGISEGKAQLIDEITRQGTKMHTFDELAAMSVNDLIILSDSSTLSYMSQEGAVSDKAMIGKDKALEAALAHAGLKKESITNLFIDIDCELGVIVYDIEFDFDGYEYEYDVNATTAAIVKNRKKLDDDIPRPAVHNPTVSKDKAVEAALAHAGIKMSDATNLFVEMDYERGVLVYEIEFDFGGYEYDYYISASDGSVVRNEKEADKSAVRPTVPEQTNPQPTNPQPPTAPSGGNPVNPTPPQSAPTEPSTSQNNTAQGNNKPPQSTANYIGAANAKHIALGLAGVSESDVKELECEFDYGDLCYEVEFKYGGYEYDYDIDAVTGDVLKSKKDIDD